MARLCKVLEGALRREPGGDSDEGIRLVARQVGYAGGVGGDMARLVGLALGRREVGYVENAIGVLVRVDALGGQRLDVAEDAVAEAEGFVERLELVVVVVDEARIGKVDGEDADALGGCVFGGSAGGFRCAAAAGGEQRAASSAAG